MRLVSFVDSGLLERDRRLRTKRRIDRAICTNHMRKAIHAPACNTINSSSQMYLKTRACHRIRQMPPAGSIDTRAITFEGNMVQQIPIFMHNKALDPAMW